MIVDMRTRMPLNMIEDLHSIMVAQVELWLDQHAGIAIQWDCRGACLVPNKARLAAFRSIRPGADAARCFTAFCAAIFAEVTAVFAAYAAVRAC